MGLGGLGSGSLFSEGSLLSGVERGGQGSLLSGFISGHNFLTLLSGGSSFLREGEGIITFESLRWLLIWLENYKYYFIWCQNLHAIWNKIQGNKAWVKWLKWKLTSWRSKRGSKTSNLTTGSGHVTSCGWRYSQETLFTANSKRETRPCNYFPTSFSKFWFCRLQSKGEKFQEK